MRLFAHLLVVTTAVSSAACSASQPRSPVAPAAAAAPKAVATTTPEKVAPPAARRPVSMYTKIDYEWVSQHITVDASEMERWGAANADEIRVDLRHVLVKVPANATAAQEASAKKKATIILAQAKKGADFAKLAKTYSDDSLTKERGGTVPGSLVPFYAGELQQVYATLAPGELDKQLVRSTAGFHVVKKEKPSAQNIELAYRTHLTMVKTRALADALADRLEQRAPIHSLENAVRATLGPAAVASSAQLVKGVVSARDYNVATKTKLDGACATTLAVAENEVALVAATDGILVVRGDEGVPGRDVGEVCPPADVELAELRNIPATDSVDRAPRLAVLTPPLPRE